MSLDKVVLTARPGHVLRNGLVGDPSRFTARITAAAPPADGTTIWRCEHSHCCPHSAQACAIAALKELAGGRPPEGHE